MKIHLGWNNLVSVQPTCLPAQPIVIVDDGPDFEIGRWRPCSVGMAKARNHAHTRCRTFRREPTTHTMQFKRWHVGMGIEYRRMSVCPLAFRGLPYDLNDPSLSGLHHELSIQCCTTWKWPIFFHIPPTVPQTTPNQ